MIAYCSNNINNNMNKNYNGWTNYATWRVNLEILGDIEFEEQVSADYLKDLTEECVFEGGATQRIADDYAQAFLSDVNYYEIANHINDDIKLQAEYDN